jgi:hypothetical protein
MGVPAEIVVGTDAGASAEIRAFDGGTGAALLDFFPFGAFNGGVRVALGDVDGDHFADIIAGSGPGLNALVNVYSGATGRAIRSFFTYPASFFGGIYVAAGDVNGDGVADVIVGAGTGSPTVRIFDGKTSSPIRDFYAYDAAFQGGVRVGFTSATGLASGAILTGPGPSPGGGLALGPLVQVLDRTTLTDLESFFAYSPDFTSGIFIGGA